MEQFLAEKEKEFLAEVGELELFNQQKEKVSDHLYQAKKHLTDAMRCKILEQDFQQQAFIYSLHVLVNGVIEVGEKYKIPNF